jgi:beta-lactamase superfamily II metal-dependent hydrolase
MIELDFLWVGEHTKTGDAIIVRFTYPGCSRPAIVVIDGGYTEVGARIVEHLHQRFGVNYVDVVISTHPDDDHLLGLTTVLSELTVSYLLIHQPSKHGFTSDAVKSDQVDELIVLAEKRGTELVEPFAGVSGFGGALTVVGPTEAYYLQLLAEEEGYESLSRAVGKALEAAGRLASRALKSLVSEPPESLVDDNGGTTPRNNTSVIVNLAVDGHRILLTGDAGVPALNLAADFMAANQLDLRYPDFFQIPHHGSRHNLDPNVLDRLLGKPKERTGTQACALATVGKEAEEHPRPEIANAVHRRGHDVHDTRGQNVWWHRGDVPNREDYHTATPLPWLDEEE